MDRFGGWLAKLDIVVSLFLLHTDQKSGDSKKRHRDRGLTGKGSANAGSAETQAQHQCKCSR